MSPKTKRSPETQKRFEQGRASARKRVTERGTIAFRADAEMIDLLLQVAAHKRLPYGTMARSWVMDRLREEAKALGK